MSLAELGFPGKSRLKALLDHFSIIDDPREPWRVAQPLREVLLLVGIGVAAGLAATAGLTRLIQTQLFGVTPHDPRTLVLAAFCLVAVACAAGYIPALRASRIDAMRALRYE